VEGRIFKEREINLTGVLLIGEREKGKMNVIIHVARRFT
jgi:hypothetical protein